MSKALLSRAYDEVIAFLARGPSQEEIAAFRLSDEAVARVRELPLKDSAGALTPDEAEELDRCAQLDQMMVLIRSRARQDKQGSTGA